MGLLRTDVSRVEIERVLLSEESVGLAPLTIIANEYPVAVALRALMPAGVNVTFRQGMRTSTNQTATQTTGMRSSTRWTVCNRYVWIEPGSLLRSAPWAAAPGRGRVVSTYVPAARHRSHSIGVLRGFLHLEPRVATDVVDGSGSGVGVALVREPAQLVLELIGRV